MRLRIAISTLMALVIVASLQSILAMEVRAHWERSLWNFLLAVFVALHVCTLAFFAWIARRTATHPVPGWRIVVAAGIFMLTPQVAASIEPDAPDGCGWVVGIWWLATAIALGALLRLSLRSSLVTAGAVCGATLMLAALAVRTLELYAGTR